MFEFDPTKVNQYKFEELLGFYANGTATFTDFQKVGLWHEMQAKLKEAIESDENAWNSACTMDTIPAYKMYLEMFDDHKPIHSFEAKVRIGELEKLQVKLYEDLFEDMKDAVMDYKPLVMQYLFGKKKILPDMLEEDSPKGRFLKAQLQLKMEQLCEQGILPNNDKGLQDSVLKDDIVLPQMDISKLGPFPTDRTDVYFLGCPSSGKSCVLAGFLNYLRDKGLLQYEAQLNEDRIDKCKPYFDKLIEGLSQYKVPQSTGRDTVSFFKINMGKNADRKITAVELSGEAFEKLAEANFTGKEIWSELGAGQCLSNNNQKTLFFLLDYSTIIGQNKSYSEVSQALLLENALTVFCSDGEGPDGSINCTMSKVKTVAVIVSKSDLMDRKMERPLSQKERIDIVFEYLDKRFRTFMNTLRIVCKKYGINDYKGHRYEPFVMVFSLGQFYVGNSVVYDETDSKYLADFLYACTDRDYRGPLAFLR